MAIDEKYRAGGVPVGTRLAAHYKEQRYVCEVVEKVFEPVEGQPTPDPIVVYRVDAVNGYAGGEYKSLSSAASAFMAGKGRADGWKFWSIEGEEPAPRERKPKAEKPAKVKKAPKATKTKKAKAEKPAKEPKAPKAPRQRAPRKSAEDPKTYVEGTDKFIFRRESFAPGSYFCEGCLAPFSFEGEGEPEDCPNLHVQASRQAAEV